MNAVSIDLNQLDQLPQIAFKIIDQRRESLRLSEKAMRTANAHPGLFRGLEDLDITVRVSTDFSSFDMRFTGDGRRLADVWRLMRTHGFTNAARPKKGDTSFSDFFEKEGCLKFWLSFSSTLCKRVQIGTKTVEQPIYETICGENGIEPAALEAPLAAIEAPVAAMPEEELPF